ncbi:MAG TPA: KH domain-containing protein [Terriglobales bacterium]|nr:KH domain-containing protein [Terriglobales bacterium]
MGEQKISEPAGDVRALIEQVAKALVDEPSAVSVNQVEERGETVLELAVAPNDLGKVIGKQGRTARAMRTLLSASGLRLHKHFELEILE